jgi:hypothetical protein
MSIWKIVSVALAFGLIAFAAFLAWTPWRAHGGRFVTEYLLLASPVAVVALVILAVSLRFG